MGLNIIWQIREEWDTEWNKLRVAVFKTLNTDDMDELAMSFQGRMRKLLGKDKNVQNWPAFQKMKEKVETFRNMLPLIQNLRAESMRERHINLIIKEVNE